MKWIRFDWHVFNQAINASLSWKELPVCDFLFPSETLLHAVNKPWLYVYILQTCSDLGGIVICPAPPPPPHPLNERKQINGKKQTAMLCTVLLA